MMPLYEQFHWYEAEGTADEEGKSSPQALYQSLAVWARQARGKNPLAFDALTAWLRTGGEWEEKDFSANRSLLMDQIIGRFLEQNRLLAAQLRALEPSVAVNPAVWGALERFNSELMGQTRAEELRDAVSAVFQDFTALKRDGIREAFAGNETGPAGTDSVDVYGYINILKDCDASVQWTLFMPGCVKQQQRGFYLQSLDYVQLPALRFIGMGRDPGQQAPEPAELRQALDSLAGYRSGFDYDLLLIHHFGKGVDVQPCRLIWGRFMQADAPVPPGLEAVDFLPDDDGKKGPAYLSYFAFAKFIGEDSALHRREGFDCNAMYDVTRNILLGQDRIIPYPDKYWTAEVFLNGFGESSSAYLFSVMP